MAQRILDIFRESGDEHLGQTLNRLARLAAAAHMCEAASLDAGCDTHSARKVPFRLEGLDRLAVVPTLQSDDTRHAPTAPTGVTVDAIQGHGCAEVGGVAEATHKEVRR